MARNTSKQWKALRVHEETLKRLEAVREQLERGNDLGSRDATPDRRNQRIGMDHVVRCLLAEWERHRERRQAHRQRRKTRDDWRPACCQCCMVVPVCEHCWHCAGCGHSDGCPKPAPAPEGTGPEPS